MSALKTMKQSGLAVLAVLALSGCAVHQVEKDTRWYDSPHEVNWHEPAVLHSVEYQRHSRTTHESGAVIGGILGGVAGTAIGSGTGQQVGKIAGATAGGYVGQHFEERSRRYDYDVPMVRLEVRRWNGSNVVVVQPATQHRYVPGEQVTLWRADAGVPPRVAPRTHP